jgi:hypothetical protein
MSLTATVEVLTAEVRVLMVGSRQVTLSVYRQLDRVPPGDIEPFGRVSDSRDVSESDYYKRSVHVVGRLRASGALCASKGWHDKQAPRRQVERVAGTYRDGEWVEPHNQWIETLEEFEYRLALYHECVRLVDEWEALPLIVLAGLR